MLKNNLQTNKGFTLVEMLVAISIFMSVMVIAVGSLISIIDVNRKDQSIKSVVDNVTFAIDSISRDMRSGSNYNCYNGSTYDGDCPLLGGIAVNYISSNGTSTYYKFVPDPNPGEGNIQRCIDTGNGCSPTSPNWQSMTAPTSTVNIKNMVFYVLGTKDPTRQPRVVITVEGAIVTKSGTTDFALQTTASQRLRQ